MPRCAAADPLQVVAAHLPARPRGKVLVVGAGKAAASMAAAVERRWPDVPLEGVVITRYEHGLPTRHIRVVEAGHPVPDEAGEHAAAEILARARTLAQDDLLLALVSGGGSSLLSLPVDSVPMADLKAVTRELLAQRRADRADERRAQAPVADPGRAARRRDCARASCALVVSDVTGDDPADIASGPCAPDPIDLCRRAGDPGALELRGAGTASRRTCNAARRAVAETPKPGDPLFARVENRVIATAHAASRRRRRVFERAGVRAVLLGDTVTGEAREVAKVYAALVREIRLHGAVRRSRRRSR